MENVKRALVISFTDLKRDPRVIKQIQWLNSDGFQVTTVGLTAPKVLVERSYNVKIKNIKTPLVKVRAAILLLMRMYSTYDAFIYEYKKIVGDLKKWEYDIIVANELTSLNLAFQIKGKTPLIFDAHEFYPDEKGHGLIRRIFFSGMTNQLLNRFARKAEIFGTVTDGLAREYSKILDISYEDILVTTNASDYQELNPSEVDEPMACVYHGTSATNKNIDALIRSVGRFPDKFHLYLLLVKNSPVSAQNYDNLKLLAQEYTNITFLDPVPYDEITNYINRFDLGMYVLPDKTTHNRYALPNKFFEFIQARLAVLTGPSVEMKNIISTHGVGVTTKNFTDEAIIETLSVLTKEEVRNYKDKSNKKALELSSDGNRKIFLKRIHQLLGSNKD